MDLDDGYLLASTEYISLDGHSSAGPELPLNMKDHAMVSINASMSILIGGYTKSEDLYFTFYFEHTTEQWKNGPELQMPRFNHAAGLVTDTVTKQVFVVVTGGYRLDSTEILMNDTWVEGKYQFIFYRSCFRDSCLFLCPD